MRSIFFLLALILTPGTASASASVSLSSTVFVEKTQQDDGGRPRITLEQPDLVRPGDTLVFVVRYQNKGQASASDFSVTNPLPKAVAFRETSGGSPLYSVDGGHKWGMLASLKVRESGGQFRRARPDEVTHIRWTFRQPLPAGASGQFSFRGSVR
jgi:uncharacterized repeat protein (TIGR01451 family)